MQVTHVNDHVTNAIIGGGQAVEFGISSSAEFYNILSSTLYKDQILAVGLTSVGVAQAILTLKKQSKKSWDVLGVTPEQVAEIMKLSKV